MNTQDILEVIFRELVWNAAAFAVSFLISAAIMRFVFHLGVNDVIHEVEEEQNPAVGASFFVIALLSAIWLGKINGSFGNAVSLREQLAWTAIGFFVATTIFLIVFRLVFHKLHHRRGEHLLQYLRREAIEENNTAMIWLIASMAVVPYVLAAFITV